MESIGASTPLALPIPSTSRGTVLAAARLRLVRRAITQRAQARGR